MNTMSLYNYNRVLDAVRTWPAERRLELVQDVLTTITHEVRKPRRPVPLEEALGLAATERRPPTDQEVKQWLEEHRMDKYG